MLDILASGPKLNASIFVHQIMWYVIKDLSKSGDLRLTLGATFSLTGLSVSGKIAETIESDIVMAFKRYLDRHLDRKGSAG